ncbi:MAG: hypothetical protein DRQ88_01540 [Epsilonproteobacteria bacterium]|nr:MAG: hypothetical protein DRQ89_03100 [Campylobacterota bacterium]RLA67760.1 MAG: hypothetical protein DRQ88_01540 [Campylobacterota bacterium]
MFIFSPVVFAGQNYLSKAQFQTVLDKHTILKKYKNKDDLFRFRKEVPGKIKFQNYYFFDTRDLFLKKQRAYFYLVNEENGPKTIIFETAPKTKYECSIKEDNIIKKIIQGKYPPHLLTEDNCSSNWSHPVTELKKFINKKMQRYRPRKGGQSLGVNKITLKGKNTIVQRIIPTDTGDLYTEKIFYPRDFIGYLVHFKDQTEIKIQEILNENYKMASSKSNKNPIDITLDILENNEATMNNLIKNRIIIR